MATSLLTRVLSPIRMLIGLAYLTLVIPPMIICLILCLPFRRARIFISNWWGTAIGKGIIRITSVRMTLHGTEHVQPDRPCIYALNHTTILDAFTSVWLMPPGTVGIAKREILFYPFYGIAWWLSGNVLIDRGNSDQAIATLSRAVDFVIRQRLSLCILPEGTRAADGRLLPFRKGIIHFALQTGYPIVPMVTTGAQYIWPKGTGQIHGGEMTVRFLPPIDTSGWTREGLEVHLEELRQVFIDVLPEDQRPSPQRRKNAAQ